MNNNQNNNANVINNEAIMETLKALTDFDNAKEKVKVMVKHKDAFVDKEYKSPYIGDMCLSYYMDIDSNRIAKVTNDLFESWKISDKELYSTALKNTNKANKARYMDLFSVFTGLGMTKKARISDIERVPGSQQIVVTNESGLRGGAVLLNKVALKKISEFYDGDFYILPSSIHEIIVMEADEEQKENTCKIVQSVNNAEVDPKEWLSNHLLRYDSKAKTVCIEA